MKALKLLLAVGWLLVVPFHQALAQTQIVDGDTLKLDGITYRLNGVDAPEARQVCKDKFGKDWACGTEATKALKRLVRWRKVTCNAMSKDKYGRTIGVCYAGGKDVGAELVSSGLAWAYRYYSTDYVNEENTAKAQRIGIWQSDNIAPWDYRKRSSSSASTTQSPSSSGCVIKGNISGSGKIYHTPSSPWYSRTKIDTSKGERWFCSEAEARAAGWRAPR